MAVEFTSTAFLMVMFSADSLVIDSSMFPSCSLSKSTLSKRLFILASWLRIRLSFASLLLVFAVISSLDSSDSLATANTAAAAVFLFFGGIMEWLTNKFPQFTVPVIHKCMDDHISVIT